jgi:GT2 family glycosyltransferase
MIGAVVVTHNSEKQIAKCIESLKKEGVTDILVVDSASQDKTQHVVLSTGCKFILLNENKGFGTAANKGAQEMNTDYVLFINPDAYVLPGSIEAVQDIYAKEKEVGVIGMMLLDTNGIPEAHSFGSEPTLSTLFNRHVSSLPSPTSPMNVDWVSGGALCIPRSLFLEVGEFDESFFLYWEDVDLCTRVRNAGYSVLITPHARAIHLHGASHSDERLKTRMYDLSADRYYKKHYATHIWYLQRILRNIYRWLQSGPL